MNVKEYTTKQSYPKEDLYQVELRKDSKGKSVYGYFLSKESYESWKKNNEFFHKTIDKLNEVIGYVNVSGNSKIAVKKAKEYEKVGYDILYKTICDYENDILWAMRNKRFNGDWGRMCYIFAIVDNHISDTKKRMERAETHSAVEQTDDKNIAAYTKTRKDVSSLVGDL